MVAPGGVDVGPQVLRRRPLAVLANSVGDEDIGPLAPNPLVAGVREARKVDGVAVGRDGRLVVAELVVGRERQFSGNQLLARGPGRPDRATDGTVVAARTVPDVRR